MGEQLLGAQQALLDRAVRAVLDGPNPYVRGTPLRLQATAAKVERAREVLRSLVPRYLARQGEEPDTDSYNPTLEGLLASDSGAQASVWIDRLLEFFRRRANEEPLFDLYFWPEILPLIGDGVLISDDAVLGRVKSVIAIAGLESGSGPRTSADRYYWGRPQRFEDLLEIRGAGELVEFRRRQLIGSGPDALPPSSALRSSDEAITMRSIDRAIDIAEVRGRVDFGILTIRDDECEAVLQRLAQVGIAEGPRRRYRIRELPLPKGGAYTLAVSRCVEPGNTDASEAARDLLQDLAPAFVLVVGIAGGVPSHEFTLGDVVVSSRIVDLSVEAVLKDGSREYAPGGGPLHPSAARLVGDIPGMVIDGDLAGWNASEAIKAERPPVDLAAHNFYGDAQWQERVRQTLEGHFLEETPRAPRVVTGAVASSDRLIKDAELVQVWLKIARQIQAIEMESAGVHKATHGHVVPFLAIRGISDVVGFKRDPKWTTYACHSAASFMRAFLLGRPVVPLDQGEPSQLSPASSLPEKAGDAGQPEQSARIAAGAILRQWQFRYRFDQHQLVELELRERTKAASGDSETDVTWTLDAAAAVVSSGGTLILRGRPGAGKTITALQIAEKLLADEQSPFPLVLQVDSWITDGRDLAEFVSEGLARWGVAAQEVVRLLRIGHIALVLNGWNETPGDHQLLAYTRLREFLLTNAKTPLVITTRDTSDLPAVPTAHVLDVRPLSPARKEAIIRNAALPDPDALLAEIERSAVLEEVTDTPLFLASALALARAGKQIPATRSALLESFVDEIEGADNYAGVLRAPPCNGYHREYLSEIAASMTRADATALTAKAAQRAISARSSALVARGAIGAGGSAPAIAGSLARHHALVLIPQERETYAFMHQQFQEWFAGQWVEEQIRRLASAAEDDDLFAFQRDVLNQPRWLEAVRFAVECLVAAGDVDLAARVVRWMAPVDLIAAAELSRVGGERLWGQIGRELGALLRQWHDREAGVHRDCALIAMLATGSPEFADLLWPIAEQDDQSLARLCSSYSPFRARSFGPGWQARVASWPESLQEMFLRQLLGDPGREELEFAEQRAKTAPPSVRLAALEVLLFQREFKRVVAIVASSSIAEWPASLFDRVLVDLPQELIAPLAGVLRDGLAAAISPAQRRGVIAALRQVGDVGWEVAAKEEIERLSGSLRDEPSLRIPTARNGSPPHPEPVRLLAAYSSMLNGHAGDWLPRLLATNLGHDLLWEPAFVKNVETFPEEVLVELVPIALSDPLGRSPASKRVCALLSSGSLAVAQMILNEYLAAPKSPPRAAVEGRREILKSALRTAPMASIIDGLLATAAEKSEFSDLKALVDLVTPTSFSDVALRNATRPEQSERLRQVVRRLAELCPSDVEAWSLRPLLAVMLGVLANSQDVPLVATWTAAEQTRWEDYHRRALVARTPQERQRVGQYGASWWWWYRGALALFGSPAAEEELRRWLESPLLVAEGAAGLVDLSVQDDSLTALPPGLTVRTPLLPLAVPVPSNLRVVARGDAIIAAIERFEAVQTDDPSQRIRTIQAAEALAMLGDLRAVEVLLRLQTPRDGWTLLKAFRALAYRGAVLPSRRMTSALEPFLAEREAPSGSSNDQWYAVVETFELLLAGDEPAVAIERMRRLPPDRIQSYAARDLLDLLSAGTAPESGPFLVELSRTLPRSAHPFPDLIEAIGQNADSSCHRRILEILDGGPTQWPATAWRALESTAVRRAARDLQFRRDLVAKIAAADGETGILFAWIAANIRSDEVAMALLSQSDLQPFESVLISLVGDLVEAKTPAGEGIGYYLVPRDATELKRRLAAIVRQGSPNDIVASRLLALVRAKRVEHGLPQSEPLHPDIELLRTVSTPWPLLA